MARSPRNHVEALAIKHGIRLTPNRPAPLSVEAVERVASQALASNGTRLGMRRVEWDISGSCIEPVTLTLWGAATENVRRLRKNDPAPDRPGMEVIMHTKCRKCAPCLKERSILWWSRAKAEYEAAARTWFGTLTLAPEAHGACVARLRVSLAKQGVDFDALPSDEKYSERLRELTPELTKWLKRVRKNSGVQFRYLLVSEAHKSGLPHFHVLIHEKPDQFVRKATLDKSWHLGFCKFALAHDAKTASYLTKYLSKSMLARVRASLHYGNIDEIETLSEHSFLDLKGERVKRVVPDPSPPAQRASLDGSELRVNRAVGHRPANVVSRCEPSQASAFDGEGRLP